MKLYDLVDPGELNWLMENGYVVEREHPTTSLAILNYTDRAQTKPEIFQTVETINYCRGLIFNTVTFEIVARPWKKFWNHGQAGAAQIPLDAQVQVTDKKDGSLGILYREPSSGRLAVATRGSFESDQAIHATAVLRRDYGAWDPFVDSSYDATTLLFEIVYPENRIVLNYGETDDLILLGSVDIEDGHTWGPEMTQHHNSWPGPFGDTLAGGPFADVLANLDLARENREGYVIRRVGKHPRHGDMVKIKQEDYLILHRARFGLSTRRIHEAIVAGQTLEQVLEPLPDEFHAWTRAVHAELYVAFNKRHSFLVDCYQNTMSYAFHSGLVALYEDEGWVVDRQQRAAVARLFQESDGDAWAMFAQLDGKDIAPKIWKGLEPPAGQTPSNYTPQVV